MPGAANLLRLSIPSTWQHINERISSINTFLDVLVDIKPCEIPRANVTPMHGRGEIKRTEPMLCPFSLIFLSFFLLFLSFSCISLCSSSLLLCVPCLGMVATMPPIKDLRKKDFQRNTLLSKLTLPK